MDQIDIDIIKVIKSEQDFIECTEVLRRSFKTVADEFNLNQTNAPTHPSNLTIESLKKSVEKGIVLYGLHIHDKMIGCIGVEQSPEKHKYYIEKVAVLPEKRHNGYGKMLMDFACATIKQHNGKLISIGIINESSVLKNWYTEYGFVEKGLKRFDHLPFEVCFMEKEL